PSRCDLSSCAKRKDPPHKARILRRYAPQNDMNTDIRAALEYHEATKHSLQSVQSDRHGLDWQNQPRPFKLYADLQPVPLPGEHLTSGMPALEAIAAVKSARTQPRVPDLATVATILHYAAGITKQLRYPGGVMPFRA